MGASSSVLGKFVDGLAVVYDTDYVANPFDGFRLDEDGPKNVSFKTLKGTTLVLSLEKGWHPIPFTMVTTANTTATAGKVYGFKETGACGV